MSDLDDPKPLRRYPCNGVLKKVLEVHCAGCERAGLGLPGDHDEAKAELRREGWGTRKGLWHCPTCKDDPARKWSRA